MTAYATLLDAFAPPEGLFGRGAIFVAMSATTDVLEQVMETFTRLHAAQRQTLGAVVGYLLLDGHRSETRQTVLGPGEIPGLHELYPKKESVDRLQHAKLALLGFSASRSGSIRRVRLVVTTANLTTASARRQLELVWMVESDVGAPESEEDATDIGEAAVFIDGLLARYHREESSLPPAERALTRRLDEVMTAARAIGKTVRRKKSARFFHSLEGQPPMFDQLVSRLVANQEGRNLLLCGSGFYEQASERGAPPVLEQLQDELSAALTNNPRRVALANPEMCGALAGWSAEAAGWALRPPVDPEGDQRALHAKFVLLGRLHGQHVTAGALYLGSANLSRQGLGFARSANIECGVVFEIPARVAPGDLFWDGDHRSAPIDWKSGEGDEDHASFAIVEAPPILLATLGREGDSLRLHWSQDVADVEAMIVIPGTSAWTTVARPADRVVVPAPVTASALQVRRVSGHTVFAVPIVDPEGRVPGEIAPYDDARSALEALLDFPLRPPESMDQEDPRSIDSLTDLVGRGASVEASEREYDLLLAAEFVERVAALQTQLPEAMLDDWVQHLEHHLLHAFPVTTRHAWARLGIPIFTHLKARALRHPELPDRYWEVLDRAASAWGMK